MKQLSISDELYNKILALKNHCSATCRKITNKQVVEKIEEAKKQIFGYGSKTPKEEIEKIAKTKTRDELEQENEKFAEFYKKLIAAGIDFEPEYKIEEHLKRMIETAENPEEE